MHRTRALVNSVVSAVCYRNGGNLVLNAGVPFRRLAVAAADATAPGHSAEHQRKDTQLSLGFGIENYLRFL